MKIYIHNETGLATAAQASTTGIAKIDARLGSSLQLDCVFHDGTNIVELDAGATGACVGKVAKQYTAASLIQALAWTKQSAATDGYRFILNPTGEALVALLANTDDVSLKFQIAWVENGVQRKTQIISLVVANAVYRDDEIVIEQPAAAWPLPGDIVRQSDLTGFSGDMVVGDKTITFLNGLIKSIA